MSAPRLIVNLARGNVICEHVEIADRPRLRMRGLLGRDSLPPGEGMLLQPAPSIHTAFMRFTIDAVFVDGTLRVKRIVEHLRPFRIAWARRSWGVLELAEGEVARRGVDLGDQLGVVEVSDELGAVENKAWRLWNWTSIDDPDEGGVGADDDSVAASELQVTSPIEFARDPTRVLVVGADRRFRSVAAALLTQRGCAVSLGDVSAGVAQLARRERADVVVLDAGLSLTDAAHASAQIESLSAPVGLVVVGEETEKGLAAMPVLPKWGSFDRLYDAIEHARPVGAKRAFSGERS